MGRGWLVPITMLNIGRPIKHTKSISDHACAHPSTPFGHYGWRYFLSKGPTRVDIAQLPVAHAHTQGNPEGVTWHSVTSGSHGICTTVIVRKNAGKIRSYVEHTSGHFRSGPFRSRGFWYLHRIAPPQMQHRSCRIYNISYIKESRYPEPRRTLIRSMHVDISVHICYCSNIVQGPLWPRSYGSLIYNYLCNRWLSPLMLWVGLLPRARCTSLCDKVCQWLAVGQWFAPGPPVSFTNKTNSHDITKILLKVALNTIKPNQISCNTSNRIKQKYYNMTMHYIDNRIRRGVLDTTLCDNVC